MTWKKEDREGDKPQLLYQFDIDKSYAGYTSYNDGKTCLLVLEGERTVLAGDDAGKREEHHEWLSTGDKFTCTPDGKAIISKKDQSAGDVERDNWKRMNPKSKAMRFINSALAAGAPLEKLGEDSNDATMFAGLSLVVEVEMTERDAKHRLGEGTTFQPLVKEYLGKVGEGNKSAAGTQAAVVANGAELEKLAKEMKANGNDEMDFREKAANEHGVRIDAPELDKVWASA